MSFTLHPTLAADTAPVGDLPLCALRLSLDARYPWCVLVPRRAGVRDLHDLEGDDLDALTAETVAVSRAMADLFGAEKMNVAALGNQVPQLHVHVIARRQDDDAWPRPVWGAHPPLAYETPDLDARLARLREAVLGNGG